tara:strand:+ start:15 stop:377 length:363 start_codon:yes stop_codon:yes gene_type:complete
MPERSNGKLNATVQPLGRLALRLAAVGLGIFALAEKENPMTLPSNETPAALGALANYLSNHLPSVSLFHSPPITFETEAPADVDEGGGRLVRYSVKLPITINGSEFTLTIRHNYLTDKEQ